ncbi:Predicted arabinose efflux permease, MFS family [Micromonospora pallida]|uniref:Predicted arabinose efflux permease, MFS family n=1 Tax=Micromonospora pallida TaxID=145854 RepID=A0A1C6S693_9ACTN|nr:MFS transporter [Micromonospora pallida]SCL24953.1 Predicted arabinose efflux permease, MFS family [Micromonospora pallida]
MSVLPAPQALRRYLMLQALRWFPVGLLAPIMVLLMIERGLSASQVGAVIAVQGFVVLLLEVPTAALADSIGRRTVLIAAGVINLASLALLVFADSLALFAVFALLQGIYRALDSGPLDSWYIDAMLAADREAEYETGLNRAGSVLGVAIALGALASSGLVALDPVPGLDSLAVPVVIAAALQLLTFAGLFVIHETAPRTGAWSLRGSMRGASIVTRDSLRLVRSSRVFLCLVLVEVVWSFGMASIDTLMPLRMTELSSSTDHTAAIMGPASSAAWLASAAGAALIPVLGRWSSPAMSAALLRILQGTAVVVMAFVAGPIGVAVAYVAAYTVQGASNPIHQGLLHRQVDSSSRTTAASLNSMASQAAFALGSVALATLADLSSLTVAIVVGAIILALAAPLYLPARWVKQASIEPAQPAAPPAAEVPERITERA